MYIQDYATLDCGSNGMWNQENVRKIQGFTLIHRNSSHLKQIYGKTCKNWVWVDFDNEPKCQTMNELLLMLASHNYHTQSVIITETLVHKLQWLHHKLWQWNYLTQICIYPKQLTTKKAPRLLYTNWLQCVQKSEHNTSVFDCESYLHILVCFLDELF